MRSIRCSSPVSPLLKAIEAEAKWTVDGTGILMANGQWNGVPKWIMKLVDLGDLLAGLEDVDWKLEHLMVNRIVPGGSSPFHVDPEPEGGHRERWHLPLRTNVDAWFQYQGEEPMRMDFGYWWGPLEYWRAHRVSNNGSSDRIHLIVDLSR